MYLRARGYCLRAMELRFPGIGAEAARRIRRRRWRSANKSDVPLLYWTAASWGSAIALGARQAGSRDRSADGARAGRAGARARRTWGKGALHEMFISLDSLPEATRRLAGARAGALQARRRDPGRAVARALRRAGARHLRAGAGSRRVPDAARRRRSRRPGEGAVDPARDARTAAAGPGAARSDRNQVRERPNERTHVIPETVPDPGRALAARSSRSPPRPCEIKLATLVPRTRCGTRRCSRWATPGRRTPPGA